MQIPVPAPVARLTCSMVKRCDQAASTPPRNAVSATCTTSRTMRDFEGELIVANPMSTRSRAEGRAKAPRMSPAPMSRTSKSAVIDTEAANRPLHQGPCRHGRVPVELPRHLEPRLALDQRGAHVPALVAVWLRRARLEVDRRPRPAGTEVRQEHHERVGSGAVPPRDWNAGHLHQQLARDRARADGPVAVVRLQGRDEGVHSRDSPIRDQHEVLAVVKFDDLGVRHLDVLAALRDVETVHGAAAGPRLDFEAGRQRGREVELDLLLPALDEDVNHLILRLRLHRTSFGPDGSGRSIAPIPVGCRPGGRLAVASKRIIHDRRTWVKQPRPFAACQAYFTLVEGREFQHSGACLWTSTGPR